MLNSELIRGGYGQALTVDSVLSFVHEGLRQSIACSDAEAVRSWMDVFEEIENTRALAARTAHLN